MTPPDHDYFFGFNDLTPWDPGDREIVLLRTPYSLDRLPDGSDIAEVCVWDPESGEVRKVGETCAWNFQQGSRERWLKDGTILYNQVEEGEECARVVRGDGSPVRRLSRGIYALAPDESIAASASFGRLGTYFPGYGYPSAAAPSLGSACPKDDGVWIVDPKDGAARLIVSLAELSERAGLSDGDFQIATHLSFNPAGTHLMFVHGAWRADRAFYARLIIVRIDGSELQCRGDEKITHPCWIDDERVVCWKRSSPLLSAARRTDFLRWPPLRPLVRAARRWQGISRNILFAEGLTEIGSDGSQSIIARGLIEEDGHFSRHPTRNVLLGDTYPDRDKKLHLYLFGLDSRVKIEVASFHHGVRWSNPGLRSDLHPRWSRDGTRVAVDLSDNGVRRMAIVDVRPALDALEEESATCARAGEHRYRSVEERGEFHAVREPSV